MKTFLIAAALFLSTAVHGTPATTPITDKQSRQVFLKAGVTIPSIENVDEKIAKYLREVGFQADDGALVAADLCTKYDPPKTTPNASVGDKSTTALACVQAFVEG